ncbi:MAG: glutamate dehydrogenase, partial [candidate division WOR-3 bacterium]
ITGLYWEEEEVYSKLDNKMTKSFNAVWDAMKEFNVDPRTAAYAVAVRRVVEGMKLRGWV